MTKEQQAPPDRLVAAYERMLNWTHEALEKAQQESVPRLREALDRARERMIELGELTREEAQRISDYLQRDIEDAAQYIVETGQDLRAWWRFDLELMERRLAEMFKLVADQTSLQLAQWAETTRRLSLYQAGEITGPGTLICDRCGAEIHFSKIGRIPPCAACGGLSFRRRSPGPEA